jgi:DNA-binding transcriptional regulator YdaS (Cro superfamily)
MAKSAIMDTAMIGEQDGRTMLAEFIRTRTTQARFAREVGCSESHLSLVLKGARGVSFGLAKRISNATGGAVPVEKLPHAVLDLVQTEAAE